MEVRIQANVRVFVAGMLKAKRILEERETDGE